MQQQNLTALLTSALKDVKEDKKTLLSQMTALSVKNKVDLSFKNLPDYLRTPTAEELIEMRSWAIGYKKTFKGASKREVRRATQTHFKIRIFR